MRVGREEAQGVGDGCQGQRRSGSPVLPGCHGITLPIISGVNEAIGSGAKLELY